MEMVLQRACSTPTATPGDLSVDGVWHCYTLEDVCRDVDGKPVVDGKGTPVTAELVNHLAVKQWKVDGATAIPAGRYRVIIDRSERFSALASVKAGKPVEVLMPHIMLVHGFDGVRMHKGMKAADTEGCPLMGSVRNSRELISHCAKAYDPLLARLQEVYAKEGIWIEVRNAEVGPTAA